MFSIVIFLFSIALAYAIDVVLVGITFSCLKNRFQWNISPRMTFLVLFVIFAFLDNYLWPIAFILDVTYTVRNETIAKAFDFVPNEPLVNLFGFGFFELLTLGIQALLAGYIGDRLVGKRGRP